MDIIYFIYGLSFFVLGVLVLFVRPKESELFFANKLWLIGLFGILHAIEDWLVLYQHIYPSLTDLLIPIEVTFLLLSNLALFEFSRIIIRKSFEDPHSKLHFIYNLYAGPVIYVISFSILLGFILIHPGLDDTIAAIRYTYGFWGSIFLGMGLYFYGDILKKVSHIEELKLYFKIAGISFIFYAFFAGIIVPPIDHFPGNLINDKWFFETFHIPVQIFRAICALAIAISSIKVLGIFRNELIEKLNESFIQIKEFNSNASHQLRTPLASMKVQIDVTLQKTREVQEYKNVLVSISEEITSQQKLINNLLLLTRMRDDTIKERFKEISIDVILLDVVGEYMIIANQKHITLEIESLDELRIKGDKTLISILITNLIDNAIKYTPSGKTVRFNLDGRVLSISDEGIGIEQEILPSIFDRFFQVDNSKIKGVKGFGLGLPMVKKIADLHKASIYIQSKIGIGTTFSVKF